MASFHGPRFPGPMFNQNFPPNQFMNPVVNRPPVPPFQRPPTIPFRPFQPPERFMQGIPNRPPQFSNFPESMGGSSFLNRPPPPLPLAPVHHNQAFRMNTPPPVTRPRFPVPFERPFRPFNQMPTFRAPRSPFQSRSPPPVPSNYPKNLQQPTNKRKKQKTREFRKLKSWMTDELFAEVKKKNALYLKAKSSDEQTAWQEFRVQRNRVSSLIKEAKIKAGLISRKIREDDTTEKPFSCDTCDRAFMTENELKEHNSQHIECDHENCTFQAHPKIVALHQKMQHDTGYADRINKLKDAAEIKKWREERKRRFPTAENVRKRKAEQLEKEARGEVLETKEFGKFKKRKQDSRNHTTNRGRRFRGRHMNRNHDSRNLHPAGRPFIIKVDSDSDSDSDSHITLKMFQGMSSLTRSGGENSNEHDNSDPIVISSPNVSEAASEKLQLSLESAVEWISPKSNAICRSSVSDSNSTFLETETSFLMNCEKVMDYEKTADESVYEIPGDEICQTEVVEIEDSDDEGPVAEPITKSKVVNIDSDDDEGPVAEPITKSKVVDIDSDEHPSAEQIVKSVQKSAHTTSETLSSVTNMPVADNQTVNDDRNKENWRKQQPNFNGFSEKQNFVPQSRKASLLEKLLADDIRHERNVILQCIRHVVNNNFFGIGAKKF